LLNVCESATAWTVLGYEMTIWLKLVGAVDEPMPDPWLTGRSDPHTEVGFNKRANVEIGEELVLYAIPQRKVIGIAAVNSHPIKSGEDSRWPWRSKSSLILAIADYDRALDLDEIEDPGGRELSASVRRQSHIALDWQEYERARAGLEAACDPSLGDICPGATA
jgi:hypothetical protein